MNTLFENAGSQLFLLSGPTSCGKTRGILERLAQEEQCSPFVQFLSPTAIAKQQATSYFDSLTKKKAVRVQFKTVSAYLHDYLSKPSSRRNPTLLIIDEVHMLTTEYFALFTLLERREGHDFTETNFCFLSATVDPERFRTLFPQREMINIDMAKGPPAFTVETEYFTCPDLHYRSPPTFMALYRTMEKFINARHDELANPHRAIVFVATTMQAEAFRDLLLGKIPHLLCKILTSTTYQEEKSFFDSCFRNVHKRFLFVATNMVESSVTIPDVDWVIDLGTHMTNISRTLVERYCPKSCLIQRAGRTGRTCHGTVTRLFPEYFYEQLPFSDPLSFCLDHYHLKCILYNKKPQDWLDPIQGGRVERWVQKMDPSKKELEKLCLASQHFSVYSSYLLFSTLSKVRQVVDALMVCLVVTIAESFLDNTRILFIPNYIVVTSKQMMHNDVVAGSNFIPDKIRSYFPAEDELEMLLVLFLNCWLSENPKDFCRHFSLNFQTMRRVKILFQQALKLAGFPPVDWWEECAVRHILYPRNPVEREGLTSLLSEMMPSREGLRATYKLVHPDRRRQPDVFHRLVEGLLCLRQDRYTYLKSILLKHAPVRMGMAHYTWITNNQTFNEMSTVSVFDPEDRPEVMSFHVGFNRLTSPHFYYETHNPYNGKAMIFLSPTFGEDEHPHFQMRGQGGVWFVMPYHNFTQDLAFASFERELRYRYKTESFSKVIQEINEEVSYRFGMVNYFKALEDFEAFAGLRDK